LALLSAGSACYRPPALQSTATRICRSIFAGARTEDGGVQTMGFLGFRHRSEGRVKEKLCQDCAKTTRPKITPPHTISCLSFYVKRLDRPFLASGLATIAQSRIVTQSVTNQSVTPGTCPTERVVAGLTFGLLCGPLQAVVGAAGPARARPGRHFQAASLTPLDQGLAWQPPDQPGNR
jgi:hypothetical protein